MSSEFSHNLLNISPDDLFGVFQTIFESLHDCKYHVECRYHGLPKGNFLAAMRDVCDARNAAFIKYLKSGDRRSAAVAGSAGGKSKARTSRTGKTQRSRSAATMPKTRPAITADASSFSALASIPEHGNEAVEEEDDDVHARREQEKNCPRFSAQRQAAGASRKGRKKNASRQKNAESAMEEDEQSAIIKPRQALSLSARDAHGADTCESSPIVGSSDQTRTASADSSREEPPASCQPTTVANKVWTAPPSCIVDAEQVSPHFAKPVEPLPWVAPDPDSCPISVDTRLVSRGIAPGLVDTLAHAATGGRNVRPWWTTDTEPLPCTLPDAGAGADLTENSDMFLTEADALEIFGPNRELSEHQSQSAPGPIIVTSDRPAPVATAQSVLGGALEFTLAAAPLRSVADLGSGSPQESFPSHPLASHTIASAVSHQSHLPVAVPATFRTMGITSPQAPAAPVAAPPTWSQNKGDIARGAAASTMASIKPMGEMKSTTEAERTSAVAPTKEGKHERDRRQLPGSPEHVREKDAREKEPQQLRGNQKNLNLEEKKVTAEREDGTDNNQHCDAKDPLVEYDPDMSAFEMCLTFTARKRDVPQPKLTPRDRMIVLFARHKQVGVSGLQQLVDHLKRQPQYHNVMLITAEGFTAFASTALVKFREHHRLRAMLHSHLLRNITKHELVRAVPHTVIDEAEKQEVLRRYPMTDLRSSIPTMRAKGPLGLYYDFQEGDIVRIDRKGARPTYRYVVDF